MRFRVLVKIMIAGCLHMFVSSYICTSFQAGEEIFTQQGISSIMKKVCDYQLAHLQNETVMANGEKESVPENGWIRGVFYTGVMAAYDVTHDEKLLDIALEWANQNNWETGPRTRHADDQVVAQTYIQLYSIKKDPAMIEPIKKTLDQVVRDPMPGAKEGWSKNKNWSWCDALYMAPPVYAMLSRETGDPKYLRTMDDMWWQTAAYLYDPEDSLYYRDAEYKPNSGGTEKRGKEGRKIFWGRGNGWAIAGLVRVLDNMPKNYRNRDKFVQQYCEMVAKIKSLQGSSGLWGTSLYDPVSFPEGETSGSSFFCYAIAWGINNNILGKKDYLPVVLTAWKGICNRVNKDGRLQWVQKVGHEPTIIHKEDTNEYAAGAFLNAGREMMKLVTAL